MASPSLPQPQDAQTGAPDVDSLQPARRQTKPANARDIPAAAQPEEVSRAKKTVLLIGGGLYLLYFLWGAALMAILPDSSGALRGLAGIGALSALVSAVALVATGAFLLQRISRADAPVINRQKSLLKLVLILAPGLLWSAVLPFMILREPPVGVDILYPTRAEDFVAPVPVTLSAARAAETLRALGYRPVEYVWDTDGDGQENDRTVEPQTTMVYDRQGIYSVVVRIVFDDGQFRRVGRRISIPRAVFSVTPPRPVVERPVGFSIAHLMSDPKLLKEVQWDLDGDGQTDETLAATEVWHTYYSTGRVDVTAVVLKQDNTQVTYKRSIDIADPLPLPFPVRLVTEPATLVGPAPFGAIFRLETDEELREVHWNYGDGKEDRGAQLTRVTHLFEDPDTYSVVARVRNASGALAELTEIVRVTDTLSLQDLQFTGSPAVTNGVIRGDVPLAVQLTPRTSVPLITFQWETEEGTDAQSDGGTIRATFRRAGIYTLTLIAQDPEGKAMRLPLRVEVAAPSPEPAITARPDGGVAPLQVTFDASDTFIPDGQDIAGFKWLFGDERLGQTTAELGAARVQHTYLQPGEYQVQLSVVMASGKEFTANRTIVVRRPQLSACIVASRTRVQAGKGIEFDASCSSGASKTYLWDVRYDAQPGTVLAQSPDQTYIYVFQTPGTYTVSLVVRDQWGNEDRTSIAITVDEALP